MSNNNQQQNIIDKVCSNTPVIVVNAGAGTGKTRTLVNSIVALVDKSLARFDEIVAITFTKKAAEEIKQRLNEVTNNKYISEIESSYIGTIDAFCNRLLKENFIKSGVDKSFNIMQPPQQSTLLFKMVQKIANESGEDLLKAAYSVEIEVLKQLVVDYYLDLRQHGLSANELRGFNIQNSIDFITDFCNQYIETSILPIVDVLASYGDTSAIREYVMGDFSDKKKGTAVINMKKFSPDELEKPFVDITLKLIRKKLEVARLISMKRDDNRELMKNIIHLVSQLDNKYRYYKAQHKLLDYQDLTSRLIDLLKNNQIIREYYHSKFKRIFVDEFQDTSQIQEDILQLLYNDNLFIVGDWKQSIYGFRNAEPAIFNKYLEDPNNEVIDLNVNYRSQEPIIELVNKISSEMFGKETLLECGTNQSAKGEAQVVFYECPKEFNIFQRRMIEAKIIADQIKDLAKDSTVALLFRNKTNMYLYDDILRREGLNTYMLSGNDYFEREEIRVFIELLRFIDNPYDEVSFVAVMRSSLFAIRDESLLYFSDYKEKNNLSNIFEVIQYIENLAVLESEKLKFKEVAVLVEKYRKLKDKVQLSRFIEMLLNENDFKLFAISNSNGNYVLSLLKKLVELAQGYSYKEFLEYVELVQIKGDDQTIELGEEEGSIQLMTIHKSKGLQFDVVYLPDIDIKQKAESSKILMDENLISQGIEPALSIKEVNGDVKKGGLYEVIKQIKRNRDVSESKRILYVAMTRAKKRLYIIVNKTQELHLAIPPYEQYTDHNYNWMKWFNWFDAKGILGNSRKIIAVETLPIIQNNMTIEKRDLQDLYEYKKNIVTLDKYFNRNIFQKLSINKAALLLADKDKFIEKHYWGIDNTWDQPQLGEEVHDLLSEITDYSDIAIKRLAADVDDHSIKNCLLNFIKSGVLNEIEGDTYRELPFSFVDNNITFEGRIDLLIRKNKNDFLIIDYKTGDPTVEHEYQLSFYYYALKLLFPDSNIELKLLLLSSGTIKDVKYIHNVVERTHQELGYG